jgi:hypothetical protein
LRRRRRQRPRRRRRLRRTGTRGIWGRREGLPPRRRAFRQPGLGRP